MTAPTASRSSGAEVRREQAVVTALSGITADAVAGRALGEVLGRVGQELCRLLGVTRCSVYVRRDDGRFRGAAGWCAHQGDISDAVRAQEAGIVGDAFSCEVIAGRAPVLIRDVPNDPRPHRPTMEYWRVRTMLGVPLVHDDDVIGLVFVDDLDDAHEYGDDDIALAELFGRMAALLLRQAILNARLSAQGAELARQRDVLEYLADVHRRLTDAVLAGADLHHVVGQLGELAGTPVVLYDEDLEVVTWSSPPGLRMTTPPALRPAARRSDVVRRTLGALAPSRPYTALGPVPAVGLGLRHLVCRLVIEGRPGGYLSIVEAGRALGDLDTKLVEHGATVLALQILAERRQIESEGVAREDLLSDLLRGSREREQLARRALSFGVDLDRDHVLVRLAIDPAATPGGSPAGASATRSLVVRELVRSGTGAPESGLEPPALSVPGAVVALLRLDPDEAATPEDLRPRIEALTAAVTSSVPVRVAVISAVCRAPEDFARAHRELREVEELARSFGWSGGGVVTADQLGLFRVVVSSGRVREALRFAHGVVAPLRDGPHAHLLDTWRAYVAAEARISVTATRLGVHENTVRYRLGRLEEITGREPSGLDALLEARLAFQVLDLAGW